MERDHGPCSGKVESGPSQVRTCYVGTAQTGSCRQAMGRNYDIEIMILERVVSSIAPGLGLAP